MVTDSNSYDDISRRLLGEVGLERGDEIYFTCPYCQTPAKERHFSVNRRTGLHHCFKCGAGGSFSRLAKTLGATAEFKPINPTIAVMHNEPLPAAQLDSVYRALLALLPLTADHRRELTAPKRQLSDSDIQSDGYRSLPLVGRAEAARELLDRYGENTLARVPGLYVHRGRSGDYWNIAGAPGLLIPCRDERGLITGLRILADKSKPNNKYRWLSSDGKLNGTESIGQLHFAGWTVEVPSEVWITEGEFKAVISARRLRKPVVSVPGVTQWKATRVLDRLRRLGVPNLVIAYDAEADVNPHVAEATKRLSEAALAMGFMVRLASWSLADGKGLDDLLLAGGHPTIIGLREWEHQHAGRVGETASGRSRFFSVPGDLVPKPELRPVYSVAEVRRRTADIVANALLHPDRNEFHIIATPPGTGKTATVLSHIRDLSITGTWPRLSRQRMDQTTGSRYQVDEDMRVLILVDSHAQMVEQLHDLATSAACDQKGRSSEPSSAWYCERYAEAQAFGHRRQSVLRELCQSCTREHDEGWTCPYLANAARVQESRIVMAPKSAAFALSEQLDRYDVVVLDESFVNHLVTVQEVTSGDLLEYLDGLVVLTQDPSFSAFAAIIRILRDALVQAGGDSSAFSTSRAIPLLIELASRQGVDLRAAVDEAWRVAPRFGAYPFERPHVSITSTGRRTVVPLRVFRDLLGTLRDELASGRRRTRLFMRREAGEAYYLVVIRHDELIDTLKRRTVIYLDATPPPVVQRVFPKAKLHEYSVTQSVRITQVANSLYTRAYLAQQDGIAFSAVQAAISELTKTALAPAVIAHKAFVEGQGRRFTSANPATKWGWWSGRTRATNIYSDRDRLILAGYFCPPVDDVRALIHGLVEDDQDQFSLPSTWRFVYRFIDADGQGLGRALPRDADPLVQAHLEWAVDAEIIQAIGRGRAALRSPDQPLEVYLLTGAPTSLPIDRLVRIAEVSGQTRPVERESEFTVKRDAINDERREDARLRNMAAAQAILAEGRTPTVSEVARRTGSNKRTVSEVLRTMGFKPGVAHDQGGSHRVHK